MRDERNGTYIYDAPGLSCICPFTFMATKEQTRERSGAGVLL